MKMFVKLFFSFLYCCNSGTTAQSAANFVIERFYACENVPNQKVHLFVKPKTFTRPQIIDISLITPIPLGNQLRMPIDIDLENKFSNTKWQHLTSIEDDLCRAIHLYMGPIASDIYTALGVIPRDVCPVPKGSYHAINYTVNFNTLKVQTFPFGKLRITIKYIEKANKNIAMCSVFIISNMN